MRERYYVVWSGEQFSLRETGGTNLMGSTWYRTFDTTRNETLDDARKFAIKIAKEHPTDIVHICSVIETVSSNPGVEGFIPNNNYDPLPAMDLRFYNLMNLIDEEVDLE